MVGTLLLWGIIACCHRPSGHPVPEPCAVEVSYGGRSRLGTVASRGLDRRGVAEVLRTRRRLDRATRGSEHPMADKSPRQHQSKKSGKSLKEKREEKKTKQATKRPIT